MYTDSMMSNDFSSETEETTLKRLYVLLGRIGELEEFVWSSMEKKKQVEDFKSLYTTLFNGPSSITLEERFTRESVLTEWLTANDKGFGTGKKFSGDIEIKEETLLHRAILLMDYKVEPPESELRKITKILIQELPFLLKYNRKHSFEYDGQSPLHLAVLKEDVELVRSIAKAMTDEAKKQKNKKVNESEDQYPYSLDRVARGTKFEGTVMSAGTPLCVAALTLNKKIFKVLVKEGADIAGKNKDDENVCHSLIRYAHHCPDKLDTICNMLEYILKCDWKSSRKKESERSTDTHKLLMMENKDGLNPLQLATKLRQHHIFKELFSYEVYCKKNLRDALKDDQWFDVTEIDTMPVPEQADGKQGGDKEVHVSLLPTILLQSPQSAIQFLEFPPIRQVIEQKWNYYKFLVGSWGLLHLMFMICLTFAAVRRANLTANTNETLSDRPNFTYTVPTDAFVTVVVVIGFIIGLAYICLQITRWINVYNRKSFQITDIYKSLKFPHSNIIYKCMFVLFSVCLILDFILSLIQVDTYENYMLMAAVIIGSYLLLFFIQMIKPFSFFTALIQVAMVDLARFAIVMIIFLLAFSTAMYMVMQGDSSGDDTFHSYESTLMKMFNVMLGLGDIESLSKARHPFAATVVFVLFVLLTTVLLLNALLAIMADTCSRLLSRYGDVTAHTLHYRLHKLSTILFIEEMLPHKLQKGVGEIQERNRFKNEKWYTNVKRRMIHHPCLAMKSEKVKVDLSAMEGILHYFNGHSSKSKNKRKTVSKVGPKTKDSLGATTSFDASNQTTDIQSMSPVQLKSFINTDTNGIRN